MPLATGFEQMDHILMFNKF